jgi:hypothetical protein
MYVYFVHSLCTSKATHMCKCFLIIKVMYVYFVGFMPLRQAVYE